MVRVRTDGTAPVGVVIGVLVLSRKASTLEEDPPVPETDTGS
jgi:hypothetical protein